jgi:hypothetical protein
MKIVNSKASAETYLRALLYGKSGTGKTTSIRTLPLARTLVLMAEPKHMPLMGHDVDLVQVGDWSDLQEAFKMIRSGLEGDGLKVNERKKDIVVIDSLSEANELCKAQILAKDRPELLKRQHKADVGGIYDEQLNQADWGLLGTRIESLVSAFTHLPCHVIFLCLERWTEDKITGEISTTPALNGQLAMGIAHHFDEVYRLEIQEVEKVQHRLFRTKCTARVQAKGSERLDELESADWTKTMTKLFRKANGKTKKEGA